MSRDNRMFNFSSSVVLSANVLLLQAVACRNAKLSEFARTMQAQNNNNQSLNIAIDCSSCYHFGFLNTKKMTVGETLRMLEKSENYILDRVRISDEFIDMVKNMMPSDYERIAEKEESYNQMLASFKTLSQAE